MCYWMSNDATLSAFVIFRGERANSVFGRGMEAMEESSRFKSVNMQKLDKNKKIQKVEHHNIG
ncbi:hypothetical protein HanRHA438_Chr14g0670701 [Helianthus annuus]|nr:hypothetical protein HanRHA438_Chr14g0670701 [Helianthus annuus]